MKIVAPAGNMERFLAAIKASADEIYLGLKGFGARRNAENFTKEEIKIAIDYAHLRGSRIFLTLNTIVPNTEIEILYDTLKELYDYGLDAVIVQDIGYAYYLHKNFPNLEIHGSTQMTVANYFEINFLKEIGFKRIVLPRELTFEEIKEIRKNTDMELEVFVSGSLCISFSGNCYMSSFLGGRSGNRGMCAQPCRKKYQNSCGEKGYFLSPKDQLLGMEEIKKIKEIGVESIKIEGRMKDKNYVYETVKYYRNLIDERESEENTKKLFNRGYSKGYFYDNKDLINEKYSYNLGEKVGDVVEDKVLLTSDVVCGDGISFLSKDFLKLGGTFLNKIITNKKNNNDKKFAKKGEEIILNFPSGTKFIYKNYNKNANDEAEKNLKKSEKRLKIFAEFYARENEKMRLKYFFLDRQNKKIEYSVESDFVVQKAKNREITSEEIKIKISELGDTEFEVIEILVDIAGELFVPMSEIKLIKRIAIEKFREEYLKSFRRNLEIELAEKNISRFKLDIEKDEEKKIKLISIASNEKQYEFLKLQKDKYCIDEIFLRTYDVAKQGNLSLHNLNNPFASSLYELLENKNEKVMLNWNLNIVNSYTIKVLEKIKKLDAIIISPEINFSKIKFLGKTRLKKGILIYSKLRGMTVDAQIIKSDIDILRNEEGDEIKVVKNKFGNELFLQKALILINIIDKLEKLCVDQLILEFTTENEDEILKILKQCKTKKGEYREYNYRRGVY